MRTRTSLEVVAVPMAAAVGLALATGGCTLRLDRRELFARATPRDGRAALAAPAGGGWTIERLRPGADEWKVEAWAARRPGATGTLLWFCGNGYGAAEAFPAILPHAAALGLDVVTVDYWLQGEPPPHAAEVRRAARGILARIGATGGPAARLVLIGGHSLGGWFALDLAGVAPVAGVFVVGAGTSPAEVGRNLLGATLGWFVRLEPDDDLRPLDGPALAARLRVPLLVIGSRRDRLMPPAFQQRIVEAAPAGIETRLAILDDVGHDGYPGDPRVWAEVAAFLHLPAGRAAAPGPAAPPP